MQGVIFTRESVRKLQKKELLNSLNELEQNAAQIAASPVEAGESMAQKNMILTTIDKIIEKAKFIEPIGRVTLVMNNIEKFKDSFYNIPLEDKDSIVVPKVSSTITIVGEVLNPNSFVYNPSYDIKDYIDEAGGLKDSAASNNIYVVSANGGTNRYSSFLFFSKNSDISKGDTIIVPKELSTTSVIGVTKDVIDIIYKLSISFAAFSTLGLLQ